MLTSVRSADEPSPRTTRAAYTTYSTLTLALRRDSRFFSKDFCLKTCCINLYVSFFLCNVLRFVNCIINLHDDDDDDDEANNRANDNVYHQFQRFVLVARTEDAN